MKYDLCHCNMCNKDVPLNKVANTRFIVCVDCYDKIIRGDE